VQATLTDARLPAWLPQTQATAKVTKRDHDVMLWTIAIILLVLWLIGWVGFHVLGAAIHILVILAIIFIVVALVKGM
jgi:hypothetical protein